MTWAGSESEKILAVTEAYEKIFVFVESEGREGRFYRKVAELTESGSAKITQIKFAPKHQQLRLAAGTSDGHFLLYQPESQMNLAKWSRALKRRVTETGIKCLAWDETYSKSPKLAFGCFEPQESHPRRLNFNEKPKSDFQAFLGEVKTAQLEADRVDFGHGLLQIWVEESGEGWEELGEGLRGRFEH